MNCPICNLPIDKEKQNVWFCPHCFSILNDEFKEKTFPDCDNAGNGIAAYVPLEDKQRTFALTDKTLFESSKEIVPPIPKSLIFKLWMTPLAAILLSIILWVSINPIVSIISFIFTIIAITVWMTIEIHNAEKPIIQKSIDAVIWCFGNNETFGVVKVNTSHFNQKEKPKYDVIGIKKKNIIGIDYDADKLVHILHVKKCENIANNIIYIPDIFAEKLTKRMFY